MYLDKTKGVDYMNYDDFIKQYFKGVKLTSEEEQSLRWLCGWERATIQNIASAFAKTKSQVGRKADDEKKQRILEMQAKGIGVTAIAKELECSRQNIYRILER